MKHYTMAPTPALQPYVRFFWVLEDGQVPYTHRSMADGCCELLFHYKGQFSVLEGKGSNALATIDGPARTFSRFHTTEAYGMFGAYIYPYATGALFGVPASALADLQVEAGNFLGRDVEEQMFSATDNQQRYQILTGVLEQRLKVSGGQRPAVFTAINEIIRTKGLVTIDALARDHFLSARQFERNFKEFAGFTPKLYSRIIRFQAAIQQYKSRSGSLTDMALECGYYDQSHFIHDFKEFSGYHPKTYFAGNNEGTNWKD
jgi:AraC-like DNA-binding protein